MRISDWSSDVCSSDLQPETYNYAKMTATILIFRKRRPSDAHHGADPLFRRRILETNAAAAMPNSTPHTPPPRSTATVPNSSPALVVLSGTPAVAGSSPERAVAPAGGPDSSGAAAGGDGSRIPGALQRRAAV